MAQAIGDLLEHPESARALAQAARQRGTCFSWRANAEAVQSTLRRAASRR
jgi:glycosyltransferase involved in cell wall biosynthesis